MWTARADEVREVIAFGERYVVDYIRARNADPEQVFTTSREDCALLYLLIRHFDRKRVFEIGTGIGTSAACMYEALRRNGGELVSSDPVDQGAWTNSGLLFHGSATDALRLLRHDDYRPDFCFIDWPPDRDGLRLLGDALSADCIIAVHDHNDCDPKGREVVAALQAAKICWRGRWFLPSADPDVMPDGTRINNCTAFWLSETLLRARAHDVVNDPQQVL